MEEKRRCKLARCKKRLVRHENETKQNWEKREFCDKSCSASYSNARRKENGFVPMQVKVRRRRNMPPPIQPEQKKPMVPLRPAAELLQERMMRGALK